jgi:NADH-quinone oxidoreductase subunit M
MSGGLLTALIFLPLLGSLFILMQREERAIWNSAFVFSLIPLALSFYVLAEFNPKVADYQFVEQYEWIPTFGISYHLGIDGISLFLVLLTLF